MWTKRCCKLQEKAGILARNSHTSVASDWTYHFSQTWKNIVRDSDWTNSFFFFTCENHRLLIWLARTHLRMKIYDLAFWWVFLSLYTAALVSAKKWYLMRMCISWLCPFKSPAVYILSPALNGLWRESRGSIRSVNRLSISQYVYNKEFLV